MKQHQSKTEQDVTRILFELLGGSVVTPQKIGKLARARKVKGKRVKMTDAEKAVAAAANEKQAYEEAVKRGYKDPKPRVNILPAKVWIKQHGLIPKKGEKAIVVGKGTPLFHSDQLTPITPTSTQVH